MARIERALALFTVVACAPLIRRGKTCADFDATLFSDPEEIEAVFLLPKKSPQPLPRSIKRCPN